jgi:hypothetical protein
VYPDILRGACPDLRHKISRHAHRPSQSRGCLRIGSPSRNGPASASPSTGPRPKPISVLLLETCGAALATTKPPKRSAEIVLGCCPGQSYAARSLSAASHCCQIRPPVGRGTPLSLKVTNPFVLVGTPWREDRGCFGEALGGIGVSQLGQRNLTAPGRGIGRIGGKTVQVTPLLHLDRGEQHIRFCQFADIDIHQSRQSAPVSCDDRDALGCAARRADSRRIEKLNREINAGLADPRIKAGACRSRRHAPSRLASRFRKAHRRRNREVGKGG